MSNYTILEIETWDDEPRRSIVANVAAAAGSIDGFFPFPDEQTMDEIGSDWGEMTTYMSVLTVGDWYDQIQRIRAAGYRVKGARALASHEIATGTIGQAMRFMYDMESA